MIHLATNSDAVAVAVAVELVIGNCIELRHDCRWTLAIFSKFSKSGKSQFYLMFSLFWIGVYSTKIFELIPNVSDATFPRIFGKNAILEK